MYVYPRILQIMPVEEPMFAISSVSETGEVMVDKVVAWALIEGKADCRHTIKPDGACYSCYRHTEVVGMTIGIEGGPEQALYLNDNPSVFYRREFNDKAKVKAKKIWSREKVAKEKQ